MSEHGPRYGFKAPHAVEATFYLPGWGGRLRVAHLTDLHFGNVTPLALQRAAVALVNRAEPDLTVLTGDFVARGRGHLEQLAETLGALRGPRLAVLGNHDHWSGAAEVRRWLEAADIEVIANAWTRFGSGEDGLAIACMDDATTDRHDPWRSTSGLGGQPALGLSHNPEGAPLLWGRGVPLVLGGHTHGGQVWLNNVTSRIYERVLGVRYLDGWYREGDRQVYVNPGVGSSVLPWRYGRPSMREVAILNLVGGPVREPDIHLVGTPEAHSDEEIAEHKRQLWRARAGDRV